MNPFNKPIKFESKKSNHFYAIKNDKGEYLKIEDPKVGQEVFEIPSISGGESTPKEKPRLILEIPIPLCQKHFDSHHGEKFGVSTCNGWDYIAIPTPLGSTVCRECKNELFIPSPYLSSANLSSADLSSANLRYADLRYANLSSANLRYADLRYANLSSANLRYADLSSADLSSANLRYADLSSADLRYADLRYAKNINELFNIEYTYWNKFTQIDAEFKKLLKKDRFLE